MAIAQAQYVDLLVKQLYGVAKTDTNTIKSPSNESIESPALIRGDTQWTQSDQIPAIAAAVANLIESYKGVDAIECTPDTTTVPVGGVYPTWLTGLTNWIPQEFGSTYVVQAWVDSPGVANPTATGTQIFASGSGGTGEYYFDNIAGLLNFIGGTIPTVLTSSKVIYIVGYRYIGLVGVTNLPSNTYIGNLNFTGTTVSSTNANGNIILTPNGSGIVQVSSALTSNANITASFFIGNGSQLTGVSAGNAVTAGTVTASAQPNITSVGTLISLDITGNLTAGNANLGNLTISNYFSGSGNLLSNIQGSNVTGNVTSAVTANFANFAGNVTVASQPNITSVGTLTSLSVTGNITGGNISTTGSGGNITGANVVSATTFSGNLQASTSNVSGNTITNNITVNLALSGNTANFTGNIISLNANLGNAARANFFVGDGSQLTNVAAGNSVTAGTVTNNAQPNITSVGTLVSLDITGNLTAGNANLGNAVTANYFIGSGNNLSNIQGSNVTGNVTSAITANFANYAGNVTVSSQPNITSVGTLTSLDITGNLSAGNANLGNLVIANFVTATLTTNAQPNITSVGTLTGLTVTGNVTGGNLNTSGNVNSSIMVNGGTGVYLAPGPSGYINFFTTGGDKASISDTGNVIASNIIANSTIFATTANISGNVNAGNANLGNAATANFFVGSGNNLSNIQGSNVTGNVTSAVTANFANYAGNVTVSSQPNITSVGTLSSLTVSGNISGGNLTTGGAVVATGNGTFGNISTTGSGGNITGANNISANTFTGTLTTNAQPNITSVGTLTSLNVSGTSNLGPVGNVTITGGTSGYYLQTNGSGTLTWAAVPTGTGISNGTSNVNIPTINGNITMSVGSNANIATVTGTGMNVSGTLNATGNANVGNLGTGGLITVTGNITGGNVNTAGQLVASTITSNVATGTAPFTVTSTTQVANLNVATAGTASTVTTNAQANITSVGILTGLTISGNLVANTFQMGYSGYAFYASSVYFATTASIADNQVLWSAPASEISAIDFTIIATDDFDTTRQTCKISAAILGTTVVWNEYGGLYINGGVGSFSVVYNAGTSSVDLVVTPDASNLTEYNILISKYLV